MVRMSRALGFLATVVVSAAAIVFAAPPRSVKIAVIGKAQANFVFIAATRGAEDAARTLSQSKGVPIEIVNMTPAQEDGDVQAQRVQQAVTAGVQAILISCSDPAKITPAINAAVDAGVAVMTFDSDAPRSKRFAFYAVDDVDLGEKVANDLAEQLGGKGKIAILAGNPDAANLKARAEGVRKGAAKHPGIEVVDVVHHSETPQDSAAAVLKEDATVPELAGWAMVGGWPLFRSSQTVNFVNDLRTRKLKVVAVDALPEQISFVDRDLVPVLWAQPVYLWGKVGVETIVDKLVGGKTPPEHIRMEPERVTKKTLGPWSRQLRDWGFTGIPDEFLTRQ